MKSQINKAYEISNAKISFISLVDKAANKRQFLIAKAQEGKANFQTYGRIIKADAENHYLTGIVYEPLVEDSHGNYMTEEEIVKAAYWFAKNGDKVDIQHSFEELNEAWVVETWVTKSDSTIEGESIKKGTWLMTVEVSNPDVWEAVKKQQITGFSMGGVGVYSEEETEMNTVQKSDDKSQKKGIIKQLAAAFGLDVIEKGAIKENYLERSKSNNFWNALDMLEDILCRYNWASDRYEFEEGENQIRKVLAEFNDIVVELLTQKSITKELAGAAAESSEDVKIPKVGKRLSQKNHETINSICESLITLLQELGESEELEEKKKVVLESNKNQKQEGTADEKSQEENGVENEKKKEDNKLKKEDVQSMIDASIKKSMEPIIKTIEEFLKDDVGEQVGDKKFVEKSEEVTPESLAGMVAKSTAAAMNPVVKSLEAVLKSRGVPSNLNDEPEMLEKSEQHYLHGFL